MTNDELGKWITENFHRRMDIFIKNRESEISIANTNEVIELAEDIRFLKYFQGKEAWIIGAAVTEKMDETQDIPY